MYDDEYFLPRERVFLLGERITTEKSMLKRRTRVVVVVIVISEGGRGCTGLSKSTRNNNNRIAFSVVRYNDWFVLCVCEVEYCRYRNRVVFCGLLFSRRRQRTCTRVRRVSCSKTEMTRYHRFTRKRFYCYVSVINYNVCITTTVFHDESRVYVLFDRARAPSPLPNERRERHRLVELASPIIGNEFRKRGTYRTVNTGIRQSWLKLRALIFGRASDHTILLFGPKRVFGNTGWASHGDLHDALLKYDISKIYRSFWTFPPFVFFCFSRETL